MMRLANVSKRIFRITQHLCRQSRLIRIVANSGADRNIGVSDAINSSCT
jgi:hypothetical protein